MIIVLVIVGVFLLLGIGIFNNLVGARNQVENAFGSIHVML